MDSEDSSNDLRDEAQNPAEIVSNFILNSPPGEFLEVLNDVKGILRDDDLIQREVSKVFPEYTKSQLTPVKIDGSEYPVILSKFNHIDDRFVDPRSKKSFVYDNVTGSLSDIAPWAPDQDAEPWRVAIDQELTLYSTEHYHEGASSVFSTFKNNTVTIHACLEGHQFQPKKFWNGRWKSIWTITFNPSKDKQATLNGEISLHVHYYEDGNVQLKSSRDCEHSINITKPESVAKDIVAALRNLENDYQRAISENYQTMSDTTFKALRRPLPVIRSKIEWNKLLAYKMASELKQQ